MARIETWFNQDLKQAVKVQYLDGNVFSADNAGNVVGVNVFDDGQPATLSGSVSGSIIRADGVTVAVVGTLSGNQASIVLPQAAYIVPGVVSIVIKLTSGTDITTLCAVVSNVYMSSTDSVVDPGTIIQSIEDLIYEINSAVATIPSDYSDLLSANGGINNAFAFENTANSILFGGLFPEGAIELQSVAEGTVTSGKAWKINGSPTNGSNYVYTTYEGITSAYAGGFALVTGVSWGKVWPLISFYDTYGNLIAYQEVKGDTNHTNKLINIPIGTNYLIVNGRTDEDYPPKVIFLAASTTREITSNKLQPYGRTLNESAIERHPTYASVAALPPNYIYNLGATVYQVLTDVPAEFQTFGTLIKVNGAYGRDNVGGYSSYILFSTNRVWTAFDTGSGFTWKQVYPAAGSNEGTRTYLFIGDSYCQGYSHDGSNLGWGAYLATALGLSSGDYTVKYNGGAGFANPNNNFITLLNSATVKAYTDIVVMGGFNDYSKAESDIVSGLSAFIARAKTLYPTAKVWVGCVGNIKEGTGASAYDNWQEVKGYIKGKVLGVYQTAPKYGASYINFSEYLVTDAGLTPTDGYHPSATGNQAIAKGVANGLMTGSCCLPYEALQ